MWIVHVGLFLNIFLRILALSANRREVKKFSYNAEIKNDPSHNTENADDLEMIAILLDLLTGQNAMLSTENNSLQTHSQEYNQSQNSELRQKLLRQSQSRNQKFNRFRRVAKQQKSSEQQFVQSSHNIQRNVGADLTTRLIDEVTDDRAQLEQHYRRLEAFNKDSDRKTGEMAKASGNLPKRLQGVGVRGRLMCGAQPLTGIKIKLVDVDPKPDRNDLMAETRTDANGLFHLSGATREESDIETILKIYHDCLDEEKECQRKSTWRIPFRYHNNGTLTEWFDVGTVNMELGFIGDERDCRH